MSRLHVSLHGKDIVDEDESEDHKYKLEVEPTKPLGGGGCNSSPAPTETFATTFFWVNSFLFIRLNKRFHQIKQAFS